MVGITSYGAYIPMLRLPLAAIAGGKPGGPEKAVAGWDEDSVTMAVAAAVDCLHGIHRRNVHAVFFASTSDPFQEKQGAAIIAKAPYRRRKLRTPAPRGVTATDLTRVVLYGPDARSHAAMVRELGFAPTQVQDPLFGRVGNAGAAFTPLLLAAALAGAKAGDRLLVVSYGDGADAFLFEASAVAERRECRSGSDWLLA